MIYIPELKHLSTVLHRENEYQDWVSEYLESSKEQPRCTSNLSTLIHNHDAFDSQIFGMKVGKVEKIWGEEKSDIQKVVDTFFSEIEYEYCTLRVSQHFTDWIQVIQSHGALFLDATVDLVYDMQKKSDQVHQTSADVTNQLTKEMEDQVLEIAQSFCHGRFYTDPDVQFGLQAYQTWLYNSIHRVVADDVFVCATDGQVHGVMTLKKTKIGSLNVWKVPLIGKHGNSGRKGVSQEMLTHLVSLAKQQQVDCILISTQSSNIPAQRGYISAGFEVYETGMTLGWKKTRA